MPTLYLSPSTQENNYYVNGGTEEQYMNLLADKMVPFLDASGIRYTRNTLKICLRNPVSPLRGGPFKVCFQRRMVTLPPGGHHPVDFFVHYLPVIKAGICQTPGEKLRFKSDKAYRHTRDIPIGDAPAPGIVLLLPQLHQTVDPAGFIRQGV